MINSEILKQYDNIKTQLHNCRDNETFEEIKCKTLELTAIWNRKEHYYNRITSISNNLPKKEKYSRDSILFNPAFTALKFPSIVEAINPMSGMTRAEKTSTTILIEIITEIIDILNTKLNYQNSNIESNNNTYKTPELSKGIEMQNIKIFISHSSEDERFANNFLKLLKLSIRGFNTLDIIFTSGAGHGFTLANSIKDSIKKELKESTYVIALLSSHALESSYVMFECGMAWANDILLPIIIEHDFDYNDLPKILNDSLAGKATNKKGLNKIIPTIAKKLNLSIEELEQVSEHIDDFLDNN